MENRLFHTRIIIKRDEIVIALLMLCMIAFFAVLPLRNASIRHMVVFAGSILFYIIALNQAIKNKHSRSYFLCLVYLLFVILYSVVITIRHFSYEVLYTPLNFISLYVLMTTDSTMRFSDKALKWVYHGTLILSALTFFLMRSPVAYLFEDGRYNGSLVLGMTNPNVTGLMISGLINILIIFFVGKKRMQKVMISFIIAGLLFLLIQTDCRSALLCTVLVIIYAVFLRNKKLPNIIVVLPMIISIMFVPVYLYLYSSRVIDVSIMGKEFFSGRQFTYREYLSYLTSTAKWLFGSYGEVQLANAHNAPLCIMSSFGIVGLVIVYWNYAKKLIAINNRSNNYYGRMAVACFMSLYIQSSMEALMFTGIFPSIGIVYLYLVFAEAGQYPESIYYKNISRDRRYI